MKAGRMPGPLLIPGIPHCRQDSRCVLRVDDVVAVVAETEVGQQRGADGNVHAGSEAVIGSLGVTAVATDAECLDRPRPKRTFPERVSVKREKRAKACIFSLKV